MRERSSPDLYAPLVDLLRSARHIALISHRAPDGDTVGSVLALATALRSLQKHVVLVCADVIPVGLHFLDGWDQFVSTVDHVAVADIIVAVDCADISQLGSIAPNILALTAPGVSSAGQRTDVSTAHRLLVNLDHHRSNTHYGAINIVDPESASVAEMVYWLIYALGVNLTRHSAEALLTGIINDTHSFQNSNATSQALRIAAALVDAGADASAVSYHLFLARRPEAAKLWSEVLSTLSISDGGRVASALVTTQMFEACGADPASDADGIVDFLRSIIGVDLAILLRQTGPTSSKASLRTTAAVDAVALAGVFGGGGHSRAAGCDVPGEPAEALAALLAAYHDLRSTEGPPAA